MDSSFFPTLAQVRQSHPGELAVLLSTVSAGAVAGMDAQRAEAVVVATARVASWSHGLQAVAVDRFAEHVLDAQEAHAVELVAARDAQRARVEATGGVWRGDTGAVGLPEPEQVAASMLAPELRISPRTMRTRLSRARALMELPTTLGLALSGDLEPWRVEAVVVASRDVAAERLVELEARLYAADVVDLPKARLVQRARRAAAKADPQSVTRGVARAPRRRCLRVAPSDTAGLMRWSLEVPDELSRRMFAAVDALAQEYLTADQHTTRRDGQGDTTGACAGDSHGRHGGREKRTVQGARLDALGDLVMANAHIETVVELIVPVGAADTTVVTRPDPRTAAAAEFAKARPARPAAAAAGPEAPTGPTPAAQASKCHAAGETSGEDDGFERDDVVDDEGSRAHDRFEQCENEVAPDTEVDEEAGVDEVLVDLVLGSVTRDTLAAGEVERHLGLVLGGWLEVAANPFLTHRPPPRPRPRPPGSAPPGSAPPATAPRPEVELRPAWFVDGLVEAPGATSMLPEQVITLLANPDTRIRISTNQPGTADGDPNRRRTYRPGTALAAKVRTRDRHCRFPGCSVPATRCHLDHVTAFPAGQTAEENLNCLCPAHHGFKHHAGWTLTMTPDGTCTWTTPTGRTHTTTPGSTHDLAA